MMKKLLLYFSLLCSSLIVAQNTYVIEWTFNSTSNVSPTTSLRNADRTIEVGDTVRWEFVESGTHNVVSKPGSQESFNSGARQGAGFVFEHTFTQVGSNPYECTPHPNSMFGVITVLQQGTLSTQELVSELQFSIKPNPSREVLNIQLGNRLTPSDIRVEVYDVLGKRIHRQLLSRVQTSIKVDSWKSGMYLVKLSNDTQTQTKRFLKQ
jgi:plastocyanin